MTERSHLRALILVLTHRPADLQFLDSLAANAFSRYKDWTFMTSPRRLFSFLLLFVLSTISLAQKETPVPQPSKKPGPAKPAQPTASKQAAANATPNLE